MARKDPRTVNFILAFLVLGVVATIFVLTYLGDNRPSQFPDVYVNHGSPASSAHVNNSNHSSTVVANETTQTPPGEVTTPSPIPVASTTGIVSLVELDEITISEHLIEQNVSAGGALCEMYTATAGAPPTDAVLFKHAQVSPQVSVDPVSGQMIVVYADGTWFNKPGATPMLRVVRIDRMDTAAEQSPVLRPANITVTKCAGFQGTAQMPAWDMVEAALLEQNVLVTKVRAARDPAMATSGSFHPTVVWQSTSDSLSVSALVVMVADMTGVMPTPGHMQWHDIIYIEQDPNVTNSGIWGEETPVALQRHPTLLQTFYLLTARAAIANDGLATQVQILLRVSADGGLGWLPPHALYKLSWTPRRTPGLGAPPFSPSAPELPRVSVVISPAAPSRIMVYVERDNLEGIAELYSNNYGLTWHAGRANGPILPQYSPATTLLHKTLPDMGWLKRSTTLVHRASVVPGATLDAGDMFVEATYEAGQGEELAFSETALTGLGRPRVAVDGVTSSHAVGSIYIVGPLSMAATGTVVVGARTCLLRAVRPGCISGWTRDQCRASTHELASACYAVRERYDMAALWRSGDMGSTFGTPLLVDEHTDAPTVAYGLGISRRGMIGVIYERQLNADGDAFLVSLNLAIFAPDLSTPQGLKRVATLQLEDAYDLRYQAFTSEGYFHGHRYSLVPRPPDQADGFVIAYSRVADGAAVAVEAPTGRAAMEEFKIHAPGAWDIRVDRVIRSRVVIVEVVVAADGA